MRVRMIFQRFPLVSYFVLAFLISWGSSFAIVGKEMLQGQPIELQAMIALGLIVIAGPCIAGVVSTYLVDGPEGLRSLFSRMTKWQVGLRWYAAALLTFPILILAVLLGLSAAYSPDLAPNFFSLGIIMGLFAGFLEEVGWMGYAYPKLRSKFGTLRGALYLALVHGLWHVIPGILGYEAYGVYWVPRFVAMWMVAMAAMRVILVWIYSNTGSVLLAQLTHASSSGFLIILGPTPITPANETLWWAIYAVVLWIAALIILARTGKDLVRKPVRA